MAVRRVVSWRSLEVLPVSDSPVVDAGAPADVVSDEQMLEVMSNSLYPGCKPESVEMVLAYCRARRIDPLLKAVHIVPMQVKVGRDQYVWRDVVMPGIGLYRLQAARTGLHAGTDEPEFGPEVEVGGVTVPEWCKVTVWKICGGMRAAFTALEYWVENYATAGRNSGDAPNAMWKRRRRGQLAKCAEAQALRRAFPEETGAQTADEPTIELGEVVDLADTSPAPEFAVGRKQAALAPPAEPELVVPATVGAAAQHAASLADRRPDLPPVDEVFGLTPPGDPPEPLGPPPPAPPRQPDGPVIGAGEVAYLKVKAKAAKKDLSAVLAALGGLVLEKLSKADFELVKAELSKGA